MIRRTTEAEPVIPTRNPLDSYFIEASTDPTLAYTLGPAFIIGLLLTVGGAAGGL